MLKPCRSISPRVIAARAPVELGRPVCRLAEQNDARLADVVQERTDVGTIDGFQRQACLGDGARQPLRGDRPVQRLLLGRLQRPTGPFLVLAPALLPHQRHKTDRPETLLLEMIAASRHHPQFLMRVDADRDDQTAAFGKLPLQGVRGCRCPGRDKNGVVWRAILEAGRSISLDHLDIGIAKPPQDFGRALCQSLVAFNRDNLAGEFRVHGRCVAGPGPDLQDAAFRAELRRLRHQRHDVRLRDGLALGDRKRVVVVGEFGEVGRNKGLARHPAHRLKHPPVRDASTGKLPIHHFRALGGEPVRHSSVMSWPGSDGKRRRSPAVPAWGRSGIEPRPRPAPINTREADPVVQTERAVPPEFEVLRHEPEPRPVGRPRDRPAGKTRGVDRDGLFQGEAAFQRT
jgi:hypothetical protein